MQNRQANKQTSVIELKWGQLRLKSLALEVPAAAQVSTVRIQLDGRQLQHEFRRHGRRIAIDLATAQEIETGQKFDIQLTW